MAHPHYSSRFFGPPTFVDLVRTRAATQPTDLAFRYLVDGEQEEIDLSNAELDRQARAVAAWLQSHGLSGQRALLLYPPGLEFIVAFYGCMYAGVVAVPVYPPRRNRSLNRIQAIADDAEAKVALTTDMIVARVNAVIDESPHLKALTWLSTDRVPGGLEDQWRPPAIDGETLAFLQYTSGSTGTPKGVMLNHRNLMHNSALIHYGFEHVRSGTGVFWLPSYHDMGLIGGVLQPLYVGRPNILMSPMSFLQKPFRWLSAISRFRGTTSGGPNFAYDLCVRKVTPEQRETLDLSTWHVAFNGAEPVREETIEQFCQMFGPCGFRREAFYPCFGMAEATLIVTGGQANDPPRIDWFDAAALGASKVVPAQPGAPGARALVGCGKALPDEKVVIADPATMTVCPEGRVGEVWVYGPSVAAGYWRQPEMTEKIFHAYLKDTGEGPFMRTGDLGFLRDGELYITGRIKDLIIFRGVNIYPQDIEQTVERSHACLVPNSGAAFTIEVDGHERLIVIQEVERRTREDLQQVIAAIRRAVSREHELNLDAVVLVEALSIPKTSSNKIQRHACRQAYLDGALSELARSEGHVELPTEKLEKNEKAEKPPRPNRPAPAAPREPQAKPACDAFDRVAEEVLEQVRIVARDRADGLKLDDPITEIGLDSLERMEILASIEERFGGRFPEAILPQLETARQVVEAVQQHMGSQPRERQAKPVGEMPVENYRIEAFPEHVALRQRLDMLEASPLGNPFFTVHEGLTNDRTIIGGREIVNFASYNYVGMSGDPVVTRAVQDAVAKYGSSVSASRLVSGEKDIHRQLETELARFMGIDDVVVMVGGHATNETTIGHLFGPGDLILHDALAHNSIVQGCILSGARRRPFPHNDWQAADRILEQFRHEYRRVLIAIEGVYSMDGDIPELPRFIEVKKRHKALLMVDEAHSMGVIGRSGRGIGEYYDIDRRDVDIWMGTLSKTFGSCGGYIGGSKALVEHLKYTAPGFVFSVGLSPPATAAALASCRQLQAHPERVAALAARCKLFLELARGHGLNTGRSKDSAVVPIILGNSMAALALSRAMFARGINVQPIVHPAVEENAARLRFFITSEHTEEQIRDTVSALVEELEKLAPPVASGAAGR